MRKRRSFRKVWRTPASCLDTSSRLGSFSSSRSTSAQAHHRQREHPGDRRLGCEQELQPGVEDLRVGQRREQVAIVAPLVVFALLELEAVEWRAAVELLELALQHLAPVSAAGVRQRLEAVVLVDRVGHQVDRHACGGAQQVLRRRACPARRPRSRGSPPAAGPTTARRRCGRSRRTGAASWPWVSELALGAART